MPLKSACARYRVLRWRAFWLLAMAASISGCVTFPQSDRDVANQNGVMMNTTYRFAGLTLLVSAGWLPDGHRWAPQFAQRAACATPRVLVQVEWTRVISRASALHACQLALQATTYILQFSREKTVRIEPHVVLVPVGFGLSQRVISISPPGPLTPTFVLRWYRSNRTTAANLVDSVAHEMFHILSSTRPRLRTTEPNEPLAYRAGSCAQLTINGGIALNSIAAGKVPEKLGRGAIPTSMDASRKRYRNLLPLFNGRSWLAASSPAAQAILDDCKSNLSDWFAN